MAKQTGKSGNRKGGGTSSTTSKDNLSHSTTKGRGSDFDNKGYRGSSTKAGESSGGSYSSGDSYDSGNTKGSGGYSDNSGNGGSSTKGGYYSGTDYSSGDSYDYGNTKGSGGYSDNSGNGGSSTKGEYSSESDYSRGDSYDTGNLKGNRGYSNNYDDGGLSTKEGFSNDDDYDDNSYDSGNLKDNGSYSNDYDSGSSSKYESSFDNDYDSNDDSFNTDNLKGSGNYSDDKPINDPPYDGYDDQVVAKQPQADTRRNTAKGGGNDSPEPDMVFTEEDVYGDKSPTPNSPNENQFTNSIERMWVWAGGAVPQAAINDPRSSWWSDRVALGMTDYVIALNDHEFASGLGIKSNYFNSNDASNRWGPIGEVLRIINSFEIAPHLMVFLPPVPNLIREAAHVLMEIIDRSPVTPRSIQLDLEGWWTRRSQNERQAGEQAIQQFFYDEWRGPRLQLGIGITCVGSVPQSIYGALQKVDFAIPQMYASERNYGRPIRESSVRTHFNRAAEALGIEKRIIVGQTAYGRYVNPRDMKEMLEIILRLEHPNTHKVHEVAFWSDAHFLNSRANREFFQRLTNQVKSGGLSLNNLNRM